MSELAERAIVFYLAHPELVDEAEKHTMVEIIKFMIVQSVRFGSYTRREMVPE